MKYVICYDIEDNKIRKKVSELLEGYGVRVNFSVFEADLKRGEVIFLLKEIKKIVPKSNSVRFYHLCKNCIEKSFEVCDRLDVFENDTFI